MILAFGSFTKRGLLADLEHHEDMLRGHIADRVGGETREETVDDRKTTDLPAVRDPKTASSREIPMIINAVVSTA